MLFWVDLFNQRKGVWKKLSLVEFAWLWSKQKQQKDTPKALQVCQKKTTNDEPLTSLTLCHSPTHKAQKCWFFLCSPPESLKTERSPLPPVPVPAVTVELTAPRRKSPGRWDVAFWKLWAERLMSFLGSSRWRLGRGEGPGREAQDLGADKCSLLWSRGISSGLTQLGFSLGLPFLFIFFPCSSIRILIFWETLTLRMRWRTLVFWSLGRDGSGQKHVLYSANLWNTYQVPYTGWALGIQWETKKGHALMEFIS